MYRIQVNDQTIEARVREQPDKSLLCTVGGGGRIDNGCIDIIAVLIACRIPLLSCPPFLHIIYYTII